MGEEIGVGSVRSHTQPLRLITSMAVGDAVRTTRRRHGEFQRHLRVLSFGGFLRPSRNLFRVFRERAGAAAGGYAGDRLRQMETRNAKVAVRVVVAERR